MPDFDHLNANRAHIGRVSRNLPTPTGPGVGAAREGPSRLQGICSSTPMTLDPHANARHSNENRTVRPGEVSRSTRTSEIKDRLRDFGRSKT